MSAVSTVTISGVNYSVYGTTLEIKQYLAGRLGTTSYDDASSGDKNKAHVQATRWIDRERWDGVPTDQVTPQPLAFPRTGLTDCDGLAIGTTVIPDDLCAAVAELILILLGDSTATGKANTGKNIKSVGAGSAQVEFFRGGDSEGGKGTIFPTEAWKLLRCFMGSGSAANSGAISSGTDECSHFDDGDRYELNDGDGFP